MFSWPQDFPTNFQFLLRWIHILGGITWIGLLYFFNLVNVQFQKEIDAATKGKANPPLLTRTLWWFRWGAIVTWFSGFIYLGYFTTAGREIPSNAGTALLLFLLIWSAAFVILAYIYRSSVAGALSRTDVWSPSSSRSSSSSRPGPWLRWRTSGERATAPRRSWSAAESARSCSSTSG